MKQIVKRLGGIFKIHCGRAHLTVSTYVVTIVTAAKSTKRNTYMQTQWANLCYIPVSFVSTHMNSLICLDL